ncbi:adenosine deaminase [bacterium]|nr:adenosine deaminase [bacterium]
MRRISPTLVHSLPKCDLHVHLDGSVRVGTIRDAANKMGVRLPTRNLKELARYVQAPPDCRSLSDFLKAFEIFYPVLKDPEILERISYELCEDASKENIRYMEVRFAPVLQAREGFPMEEVVKSVLKGLKRGERDFKIRALLLLCCYRSEPPTTSIETVNLALKYREEGVVGIDLAGDEAHFPVGERKKAFLIAKKNNLPATIHAGEAGGAKNIRFALEVLGGRRIGHGVRLKEDYKLLEKVKRERIPLEMCLTSNVQTQVVKEYDLHPFKEYYDLGIPVTINTDDRSISNVTLTSEIIKAIEYYQLSLEDIKKITLTGIEYAFITEKEREDLKKKFEKEFQELGID